MITVGMNYQVREGKQAVFENAFNKVLNAMNGMPGHDKSFLYRDVNNPLSYLIISDWSDRKAFDAFIASDAFRSVANWGKEEILTGRPKHEVYER